MIHILHTVALAIIFASCIGAAVLQIMMSSETKTARGSTLVLMNLFVDGSEFTERGLKYRDCRRICILSAFGTMLLLVVAKGIATAP